jgi:hypothetical protein
MDHLPAEVDVLPMKAQEFALPEPAEDRCCEECPVSRIGRFEKAADLVSTKHRSLAPLSPRTFGAVEFGDGIYLDQTSSRGVAEESRQRDEYAGDRRARVATSAKVGDQRRYVVDSDLVKRTVTKPGKHM